MPKPAFEYIVKEPDYCGGKAAIGTTRVRVNNVAFLHKEGRTIDEIRTEYPTLTRSQIYAALARYHDHRDEIEAELAEDEGWDDDEDEHLETVRRGASGRPAAPRARYRESPSSARRSSTTRGSRVTQASP
jgi:uncharacterized protein (DUF433 family)